MFYFRREDFPYNCGIAVVGEFQTLKDRFNFELSKAEIISTAEDMAVNTLLCTISEEQDPELRKTLLEIGFEHVKDLDFVNQNSGNKIETFYFYHEREIKPDDDDDYWESDDYDDN